MKKLRNAAITWPIPRLLLAWSTGVVGTDEQVLAPLMILFRLAIVERCG